jgi:hypothetical protein
MDGCPADSFRQVRFMKLDGDIKDAVELPQYVQSWNGTHQMLSKRRLEHG